MYESGESYWWNLTDSERLYLESVVTAIVRHYAGSVIAINKLITACYARNLHTTPVIAAILWRLTEELAND